MRNSIEQAKSRRHLTANVETKRFSDLHENVNPAIINKCETQDLMFSNLRENANSALPRNLNSPSGTLPEPRKRHLPLPRPLSLDAFCAQMAPHIFKNSEEPRQGAKFHQNPRISSRSEKKKPRQEAKFHQDPRKFLRRTHNTS